MIKERLADPVLPVYRKCDRKRIEERRASPARPRPVLWVLDEAGADRVAQDISEDGEQMRVLLNRETFEATLSDMPAAGVVPMVPSHMARPTSA